jgi:hypothetical protein
MQLIQYSQPPTPCYLKYSPQYTVFIRPKLGIHSAVEVKVKLWNVVFWDVMLCSLVRSYQRFERNHCSNLQGSAQMQYCTPKK